MSSSIDNLKLYYFNFGILGRSENVRLLLEDADPGAKSILAKLLPSSSLSYIITPDGQHFNKTYPIFRYISRKLGKYAGRNDEEAQSVDASGDLIIEWFAKWVTAFFSEDEAISKPYKEEYLPQQLELWNKILSQNEEGPYILGDEVSYADFGLYHVLESDNKEMKFDVEKYPNIQAFAGAIAARPNIAKYFATGRK